MTDNGLAALTEALHHYRGTCELWTMSEASCPIDHAKDAAAILGPRGVFLPDGLPEVSIKGLLEDFDGAPYPEDFQRAVAVREADYLGQIATLRVALDGLVDDFVDELPELPDDHIIEWETTLGALRRAALDAVKETP